MKPTRKLMLNLIISMVASATALVSVTFSWILFGAKLPNQINLNSGDSEAVLQASLFQKNFSNLSSPTQLAYYNKSSDLLNVTQTGSSSGVVALSFNNGLFSSYDLMNAYYNDVSLSSSYMPSLYLELRIIKVAYYGFTAVHLDFTSLPSATSGNLNFSTSYPFTYRYAKISNSTSSPMTSALPSQLSVLQAKTFSPFFYTAASRTSGIDLFTAADVSGSPVTIPSGSPSQCYVPGFSTKVSGAYVFSVSVLLEVSVDLLALYSFIHTNAATAATTNISLGINFKVGIRYSNNPITA